MDTRLCTHAFHSLKKKNFFIEKHSQNSMSFGKGVITHVLEHGTQKQLNCLDAAIITAAAFGFGCSWGLLDERVEQSPELAPIVTIEVDDIHPRSLVGLVKDKETNAALQVLANLPYWEWETRGCLDVLKGYVTVVRFVNKKKPRLSNGGGVELCATLDLDMIAYFLFRGSLE